MIDHIDNLKGCLILVILKAVLMTKFIFQVEYDFVTNTLSVTILQCQVSLCIFNDDHDDDSATNTDINNSTWAEIVTKKRLSIQKTKNEVKIAIQETKCELGIKNNVCWGDEGYEGYEGYDGNDGNDDHEEYD